MIKLGDIYTMPIGGGQATRISGGPAYEFQPRFSPDGSRVIATSAFAEPAMLDTRSGRLVIPCNACDVRGQRWAFAAYSDDHGQTWQQTCSWKPPSGIHWPH